MEGEGKIVCVTGASGYIASWLVKQLLLRRYTVNATVRSLHDPKKVQHLLALEGAKDRLRLFKADLTEEGSFDAAINGCHGVFHTASPCIFDCNDPQVEIIGPATEGTMNVLSSCAKFPSVKRVIFTSSAAAMLVNHTPTTRDTQVDESWWSDPQLCQELKLWYPTAKTLAEETAWKFAKDKGIDLVSICPGWTIGPLLQPALNESCAALLNLIGAEFYPDMTLGWVDVKDIAHAHVQAFEIQSASGRYCVVEREAHYSDVINTLQRLYPTLQLPHKSVEITPCFPPCKFSRKRAQSLGIDFIPLEISLKETIESMKEKQLLSF